MFSKLPCLYLNNLFATTPQNSSNTTIRTLISTYLIANARATPCKRARYDLGHIWPALRNSTNTLFSRLTLVLSLKMKNDDVSISYLFRSYCNFRFHTFHSTLNRRQFVGVGIYLAKSFHIKYRMATGRGNVRKIWFFFKVREKSGNFANWSEKF